MNSDVITGIAVIVLALGAILLLVLWSRKHIDRIAGGGFGTARQITRSRRERK